MKTVPVFCGKDCGGNACPLLAHIEDGRVTRITNNPLAGRYLSGCRRGFMLHHELYAKERITDPLIRSGERGSGNFRKASWDEALTLVAARLQEIQNKHGCDAVLNLSSAGQTSALHNTEKLLGRFLHLSGACTDLSSNYSNGAARFALPYVFGKDWTSSGFDSSNILHAELIILWGANVLEARLGSDVDRYLLEAAERGIPIISVDPRKSRTIQRLKSEWIPIRPGSDTALMLALMQVWIAEDLIDRDRIDTYSYGYEALEAYISGKEDTVPKSPEWAEQYCGVEARTIRNFARRYAAAKPALLFPGFSIQRVFAGEDAFRLSTALQVLSGNAGKKGASCGSLNNRLPTPRLKTLPVPPSPCGSQVPVVRWPDLILEGLAGGYPADIHAVYAMGCNFLNQGADINKNIRAFLKADFIVCHDLFMTPTARYSDVVLPAAHSLEKSDIGIPWSGNFLSFKKQVSTPAGRARSDYAVLCELAERMGFGSRFSEGRTEEQWLRHFMDNSELDDIERFMERGIYVGREQNRCGLDAFFADPHSAPLSTESGLIELCSKAYERDTGFSALPRFQQAACDSLYPILLISPKAGCRTHSQGDGIERIYHMARHVLHMHTDDALERGIGQGDRVRIFNREGSTWAPVRMDRDICRGTASLPEGRWFRPDQNGEDTAGSVNLLTSTEGTKPGKANIMHAIGVQIEAVRDNSVPDPTEYSDLQ